MPPSSTTTAAKSDKVGAPEPTGRMPVTYLEAKEAGTLDNYEWSDGCDTDTGRVKAPSVYTVPCVPVFTDADNGGATTSGVTADSVKIVRYVGEQSADLQSLIAGIDATDTPEELTQTYQQYLTLSTSLAETYGRKVEFVDYQGTGAGTTSSPPRRTRRRSCRS